MRPARSSAEKRPTTDDAHENTLTINSYEEQAGILDLAFSNVVLENVQSHALCTIDGTLTTTATSF